MATLLTATVTCAGMLLFTAGPSFAQAGSLPPETLSRLRLRDSVTVDIGAGTVQGRLVEMAADGLVVANDAGPRRIDASEIDRIERRRKGVLLGALVGAGAGVATAALLCSGSGFGYGCDEAKAYAMMTAIGAGTGLAIDALIDLPRTVYVRDHRQAVFVEPRLLRGGGRVLTHVRF